MFLMPITSLVQRSAMPILFKIQDSTSFVCMKEEVHLGVYTNANLKERKSITTQNQAVIQNECGIGSIIKNYDDTN